ncbi:MAG: hypothetical protein J7604_00540 [Sporocytophaga sp.]|uniref:hypothetical protein n=1 Tax=Sporocytophaga sp. TaxID=2231183 RepID=UPI001B0C095F|nr:hypothetical protein [Sporocytophaga sp.]MBO9698657.1 hypothetical protein [Sporocytophaga sp.]
MKRSKLYILALASLLTFFGCKKEKVPGPTGPAGPDGKSLEEHIRKNGFVKMDVYTKSSHGDDSLILSTEYLHEDDFTNSQYSEGELSRFYIWRLNTKNLTSISISSNQAPSEPLENLIFNLDYTLHDTLGNGKLLSLTASATTINESMEISDYSFDKATGKIKFNYKAKYQSSVQGGMDLTLKGSVEAALNEEIYLRKGSIIE